MSTIDLDTKLGGIFGVVAMIAIGSEVYLGGFSVASCVAGVKDASGTLVSLMVFLVAVKTLVSERPKNFTEDITNRLDVFEMEYLPLIFKVSGYKIRKENYYTQGFCILKDISKFSTLLGPMQKGTEEYTKHASYSSRQTTQFIQLPDCSRMVDCDEFFKIEINFKKDIQYIENLQQTMKAEIGSRFQYTVSATTDTLTVEVPKIESRDAIDQLFSMLGFVVRLFQIGNTGSESKAK